MHIYDNEFIHGELPMTKQEVRAVSIAKLRLKEDSVLIDVGAGTGAYAIPLFQAGNDVHAIELVKHNLRTMQKKCRNLDAREGNAMDLSKFEDDSFDIVLLFGPMYHLISHENKLKALNEAKRVVKDTGFILISYCLNEYAIIEHGIKEGFLKQAVEKGEVDENFHVISKEDDLYSYVRIEDINKLKDEAGLTRYKIIGQDGAAEYLKREINHMDEESFACFMAYHLANCERYELLGASRHALDILRK